MTSKKDIVRLMAATGGSEHETQIAAARFDHCATDDERAALFAELKDRRKPTAASAPPSPTTPIPAASPAPEPAVAGAGSEKQPAPPKTRAPADMKTEKQHHNKGDAKTVKSTKEAATYAAMHGVKIEEVGGGPDGKVGNKEVKAHIAKNRNG